MCPSETDVADGGELGDDSFTGTGSGLNVFDFLADLTMCPLSSRFLRSQSVCRPLARLNRGKMCASVLKTTLLRGMKSSGENRR